MYMEWYPTHTQRHSGLHIGMFIGFVIFYHTLYDKLLKSIVYVLHIRIDDRRVFMQREECFRLF